MSKQFDSALHVMEVQGGSFVRRLAACYYAADSANKRILRNAFKHIFDEYEARFRALPDLPHSHRTQPAESLMGIALRQLKDEGRWKEIAALNADRFPDMGPHDYYPVGTVLVMPEAAAKPADPADAGCSACMRTGESNYLGEGWPEKPIRCEKCDGTGRIAAKPAGEQS